MVNARVLLIAIKDNIYYKSKQSFKKQSIFINNIK